MKRIHPTGIQSTSISNSEIFIDECIELHLAGAEITLSFLVGSHGGSKDGRGNRYYQNKTMTMLCYAGGMAIGMARLNIVRLGGIVLELMIGSSAAEVFVG